jgi:hypothetical protein
VWATDVWCYFDLETNLFCFAWWKLRSCLQQWSPTWREGRYLHEGRRNRKLRQKMKRTTLEVIPETSLVSLQISCSALYWSLLPNTFSFMSNLVQVGFLSLLNKRI